MRFALPWCAVVSILGWSAGAGAAGQERGAASPAPTPVFRSAVDLVALQVIVTDTNGRFVTGLQMSDFIVLEDGVAQDVTFFSASEAPLDVALLLDTSASMTRQLPAVRAAARGFTQVVRDIDRVMVLDLKNTTRIVHPLGARSSAAAAAIGSLEAGGSTGLYNGLYLTMRQLAGAASADGETELRRQAIVVLSDGRDTASLVSFDDVRDLARRSGVAIYAIQLDPRLPRGFSPGSRILSDDEYALRELAVETGGQTFFVDETSGLTGVYASIAAELSHQYALGYTPKAARADGGFRQVSVQVRPGSGVRTRTRAGYLAAAGT